MFTNGEFLIPRELYSAISCRSCEDILAKYTQLKKFFPEFLFLVFTSFSLAFNAYCYSYFIVIIGTIFFHEG